MTKNPIDAAVRRRFTIPLLKWYHALGRDLPWRSTDDPYRIWLSEIMLQQTQVATALPYYHRFLEAFPTIKALASAELEAVLKLWQGLGYYARARNLHRAAQILVAQFSATMPESFESVLALPGIGRSTAGAILTIAHGKRYPILDGNVRRVLCRFFAIEEDPREKSVDLWLWHASETLMPKHDASHYLQAIMDLGATVCTPKQASCTACPVEKSCAARKKGLETLLPLRAPSKKQPHYDYFAGVLCVDNAVLIRRRPLKGLLGGLWEFPSERVKEGLRQEGLVLAYERFFQQSFGVDVRKSEPYMTIRHVFTHFKMTLHVFLHHTEKRVETALPVDWIEREALSNRPFSSAHQKIVLQLTQQQNQGELFQ